MEKITSLGGVIREAQRKGAVETAIIAPYDGATMNAVKEGVEVGLIVPELFGVREKIEKALAAAGMDAVSVKIRACEDDGIQAAIDSIREKRNHLLMKGAVSTPALMKACLNKERGLNKGKVCCHVIVCEVPGMDRLLTISDGGLNVLPTVEQKADIIRCITELMHSLGIEVPKIAVLASMEEVKPNIPATLDAAVLTQMNRRGQIKGCIVDGPLALDNIISEAAAKKKGIQSEVAGCADGIVVPNIETGNALGKSMGYWGGSVNAGIVLGAAVPIILPSRASKPEAKWGALALGVMLVHQGKEI